MLAFYSEKLGVTGIFVHRFQKTNIEHFAMNNAVINLGGENLI